MNKFLIACGGAVLSLMAVAGVDVAALDETDMFPFVPTYGAVSNAVVDMSGLLAAPAGKDGRIRVQDGHFVNDKGRVKLNGTNLTGPANFPTHAEAERLAARLARFGLNCVRICYLDAAYGTFMLPPEPGILAADFRTGKRFDPERRDRLDYLISQFKQRGIYVDMNLHVARTLDARDGFAPGTPWANKGVNQFDPRFIAEEKAYAKELLEHVNPYTGMNYLKDPVVAVVELNNEEAIWSEYLEGNLDALGQPYATTFQILWNDWLTKKYASKAALAAAWKTDAVPFGPEQIPEGTFDRPVNLDGRTWALSEGPTKVAVDAGKGVLRVAVAKKEPGLFPQLYRRVAIAKGHPYTVSFRIRRTAGAAAEVGFAVADRRGGGWRSLGVFDHFTPGTSWMRKTYSFEATENLARTEIEFTRFGVGAYEIADLSFRTGRAAETVVIRHDPWKGEMPIVKLRDTVSAKVRADFSRFIDDTELAYWTSMQKFLHQDLGLEAPVSGTQLGYSPARVQKALDYVDNHAYWCHPSIWNYWMIENRAMVNAKGSRVADLARERVKGKPYTVSEYNHPYPIFYGAEGQPMLRAYGARLGWDGVFEYSYNNRQEAEPINNSYFFNLAARTDVLVHFPACAAMYLRGDVRETQERDPVFANGSPELKWNLDDPQHGSWTVDTPNTKLFTGFPQDRTVDLGGVKIAVGKTKLGWATVSLVSHDATGFGEKGRASILLTATGLSHNGGAKFTSYKGDRIACRGKDWGTGKTLCEGIRATITLPSSAARTTCWALDEAGARTIQLPVTDMNGQATLSLDPKYRTAWYEIQVK